MIRSIASTLLALSLVAAPSLSWARAPGGQDEDPRAVALARETVAAERAAASAQHRADVTGTVGKWTMITGAAPWVSALLGIAWVTGPVAPIIYGTALGVFAIGGAVELYSRVQVHKADDAQTRVTMLSASLTGLVGAAHADELLASARIDAELGWSAGRATDSVGGAPALPPSSSPATANAGMHH